MSCRDELTGYTFNCNKDMLIEYMWEVLNLSQIVSNDLWMLFIWLVCLEIVNVCMLGYGGHVEAIRALMFILIGFILTNFF